MNNKQNKIKEERDKAIELLKDVEAYTNKVLLGFEVYFYWIDNTVYNNVKDFIKQLHED